MVVDASFGHRIDPSEVPAFEQAVEHGEMVAPPAGAVGRGDGFILRIAEKSGALVLSNDSFQEFHAERPWLFEPGRLIGGKPVPGVGWIFTPRTPVRGAKSRSVTSKSKRDAKAAGGGAAGRHRASDRPGRVRRRVERDGRPRPPRRPRPPGDKASEGAPRPSRPPRPPRRPKPTKATKAAEGGKGRPRPPRPTKAAKTATKPAKPRRPRPTKATKAATATKAAKTKADQGHQAAKATKVTEVTAAEARRDRWHRGVATGSTRARRSTNR